MKHLLSDVLVGAGIGTLVGLGLPWLLHYRFDAAPAGAPPDPMDPTAPSVSVVPLGAGAAVVGGF